MGSKLQKVLIVSPNVIKLLLIVLLMEPSLHLWPGTSGMQRRMLLGYRTGETSRVAGIQFFSGIANLSLLSCISLPNYSRRCWHAKDAAAGVGMGTLARNAFAKSGLHPILSCRFTPGVRLSPSPFWRSKEIIVPWFYLRLLCPDCMAHWTANVPSVQTLTHAHTHTGARACTRMRMYRHTLRNPNQHVQTFLRTNPLGHSKDRTTPSNIRVGLTNNWSYAHHPIHNQQCTDDSDHPSPPSTLPLPYLTIIRVHHFQILMEFPGYGLIKHHQRIGIDDSNSVSYSTWKGVERGEKERTRINMTGSCPRSSFSWNGMSNKNEHVCHRRNITLNKWKRIPRMYA